MAILKVRDDNGNVFEIPAIVGPKGENGDDYVLTDTDKQEIAAQASKLVTKSSIGLGNVDNTSDDDKPVSTAQQKAIETARDDATDYVDKVLGDYQPLLESGTNIKTVNGVSLLGSGDISLGGLQLEYLGDAVQGTITTIPTYAKGIAYAVQENQDSGMVMRIYKSGIVYGSPSPYYHTRYHLGFKNIDLKNMGMAISIAEELDMYIGFLQNDVIRCSENTLVSIYSNLDNQVIECPVWIIK